MSSFFQYIFDVTCFWIYLTGLTDDILASEFQHEQATCAASEATYVTSMSDERLERKESCNVEGGLAFHAHADESTIEEDGMEHSSSKEVQVNCTPSGVPVQEKTAEEDPEDVELGNFFLEDEPSNEGLPPEVCNLQRKEKMRAMSSEKNLEKLDGIWRKVG